MAPHNPPTQSTLQISPEAVVLAEALAKSCPSYMTIREYCALLVKHGVKGHRNLDKKHTHVHTDEARYWKHDSKQKQQTIDDLRTKLGQIQGPASPQWDQFVRTVYGAIGQSQRTVQASQTRHSDESDASDMLLVSLWELGQAISSRKKDAQIPIVHVIYYTDRIFERMTEPLTMAISDALTLHGAIATATEGQSSQLTDNVSDKRQRLKSLTDASLNAVRIARKIFPSFMKLIADLSLDDDQVVFQATQAFKTCVDLLLDVLETSRLSGSSRSLICIELRRTTKVIMEELLALLITTLHSIEPESDVSQSILEGIVYHLFQQLGPLVHEVNFGESNHSDDLQAMIDMHQTLNAETELELQKAAHPKLIHLLPIVKVALQRMPHNADDAQAQSQRSSKQRLKSRFHEQSTSKVRATLLKAIYQDGNGHLSFLEGLHPPQPGIRIQTKPARIKVTNVRDWVNGEMWRMIGKDLLLQEFMGADDAEEVFGPRETSSSAVGQG